MKKERLMKLLSSQFLTIATLASLVLAVTVGLALRYSFDKWTERDIMYLNFIGELFLRMLKGLILPLVILSLVDAIGSLDLRSSGKIGARAIMFYMITTVMAVILGIILVITIRPGIDSNENVSLQNAQRNSSSKLRSATTVDTMLDLVRNMLPPNLVQATLEQYQTVLKQDSSNSSDIHEWHISHTYGNGMNIIGLVVAACVCGIAISSMHESVNTLRSMIKESSQVMMKITSWVIAISPVGIFFLTVSQILKMDDLNIVFGKLGLYLLTVIGGILFHGFVVLPIIYYAFTRKSPYVFIAGMGQALITAFGTGSSSATLPVTINCLEEKNKVSPTISRFMLPIGATINMDGTALYEAVAAIFIAQLRGISLSFGKIVAVSITSTAASIGAAGIPQAGLVTLVMVLDTVGLPAEDVSLILAVDWILDRVRTVVNVLGDAIGAGIVQTMSQAELIEKPAPKHAPIIIYEPSVTCEIEPVPKEN